VINHIRQVFNWLNATLNLSGTTIDYTETFYITLSGVTIWVNFLYVTPFRRNRQKLSLYYAQKPVSQISLLQTASFKETDQRILLGF
jgi:hypothetical protein